MLQPATCPAFADRRVNPPIPRPRLAVRCHPDSTADVKELLTRLASPGTSGEWRITLTMITGGATVAADDSLPPGVWVLEADGKPVATGTVVLL